MILDMRASHNFIDVQEAKCLCIKFKPGNDTIKAVNSQAKPIIGNAENIKVKFGDWQGELNFTVVPLDDYKVVLGLKFFRKVNEFPTPKANSFVIVDTNMMRVIPLKLMERTKPVLSALQLEGGLNHEVCNMNSMELGNTEDSTSPKEPIPEPVKLPKEALSKCKIDKAIEPKPSTEPPFMTPYHSTPLTINLFQSNFLD